jgi:hypothetical protein
VAFLDLFFCKIIFEKAASNSQRSETNNHYKNNRQKSDRRGLYCARLDVSQLYGPLRPFTAIASPFTFYYFIIISGARLSPLGTAATSGLLYKPQMIDEDDCGAIGGMKIGKGNRSARRKPAPAPLCPPQIPHDQTRVVS